MQRPVPIAPGAGQESVWDFPRPPLCEPANVTIAITHNSVVVAQTSRPWRVCETSHAPTYYLPPDDITVGMLRPSTARESFCEWKGVATYWNLHVGDEVFADIAWSYAEPSPGFVDIRDHVAFYPDRLDSCTVDGEEVTGQPGGFYGGWITSKVVGPFKGGPGSQYW